MEGVKGRRDDPGLASQDQRSAPEVPVADEFDDSTKEST